MSYSNLITDNQIRNLHHTSMKSFYDEQKATGRFEILEGKEKKSYPNSTLLWFDNQLESLLAFNYYSDLFKNTLHLNDMADIKDEYNIGRYCVLVNTILNK